MKSRSDTRGSAAPTGDIKALPVARPGRWAAAVVVVLLATLVVRAIITDPGFQWPVVGEYLFNQDILHGVVAVIYGTVIAMTLGVVLGVVLAVMRMSPNPVLKACAWWYIFFFRGTPLLVQITFWFNIGALFPHIAIGIPFGPQLMQIDTNSLINSFTAAVVLGLGLNEGAYMAEIVRGGILAVPAGQSEAAGALALTHTQTMRWIVLPQAMRVILPPTGNQAISMLKNMSMASVVGFGELFFAATAIYSANYKVIPLLIVASVWYLALTSVAYVGQSVLERRGGRGYTRRDLKRTSRRPGFRAAGKSKVAA